MRSFPSQPRPFSRCSTPDAQAARAGARPADLTGARPRHPPDYPPGAMPDAQTSTPKVLKNALVRTHVPCGATHDAQILRPSPPTARRKTRWTADGCIASFYQTPVRLAPDSTPDAQYRARPQPQLVPMRRLTVPTEACPGTPARPCPSSTPHGQHPFDGSWIHRVLPPDTPPPSACHGA
jgi:hypothetical protein